MAAGQAELAQEVLLFSRKRRIGREIEPDGSQPEEIRRVDGLGYSAFNLDYTLVLGTVILYAALIIACNLVVDVVQVWLNPRLKFE